MIGVLDWFGLEVNKVNGFEQMCMNAVSEMLQRLFLNTVFVEDLRLYKEEGLAIEADFPDNQPTVDLFFTVRFIVILKENRLTIENVSWLVGWSPIPGVDSVLCWGFGVHFIEQGGDTKPHQLCLHLSA